MTERIDWERIARYVSGESTAVEVADVERWMSGDASRAAIVTAARRRWQAAADDVAWNVDAAWARLAPRLSTSDADDHVVSLVERRASMGLAMRRALQVAAGFLVVAGAGLVWTRSRATVPTTVAESAWQTTAGERRVVRLPDGTQATLGAGTVLRLAEGFGGAAREMTVVGEALFVVQHDEERPFRVRAGGVITEDLGTVFSVRAYANEASVRVAVSEGSVSVRRAAAGSDPVVLSPNDVAVVPDSGDAQVARAQRVEQLHTWAAGELVFDDTPLGDVARALERWYDIEVRFTDTRLQAVKYSARLSVDLPIDEVLQIIAPAVDVRMERAGRVVTVRPGGGRAALEPAPPAQRNAAHDAPGGEEDGA